MRNNVVLLQNTALHHACASGQAVAVQLLLNSNAEVTAKNCKGYTPLDCAIEGMHNNVALCMLQHFRLFSFLIC